MPQNSIQYLEKNGFKVQVADASPVIMTHLESYFLEPNRIGPKLLALPQDVMAELIARGEKALLDVLEALFEEHVAVDAVEFYLLVFESAQDLGKFPHVMTSVVNYGLPSFAGRMISSINPSKAAAELLAVVHGHPT